ncbi:MAG: hypothetical protein IPK32_18180 [Verrucomicrobiaceae bacterium]|nr:hypothetical protein [Verrucomicrobiaceae bacterium]
MSDSATFDSPFGGNASSSTLDPFQSAKASALKAAEELRQAASQKAGELRGVAQERVQHLRESASSTAADLKEKTEEFRQIADERLKEAGDRLAELRAEAENFAREKPVQALATAFGAGLLLGLILRR